jgi:hypothetical protein
MIVLDVALIPFVVTLEAVVVGFLVVATLFIIGNKFFDW